MSSLWIFDLKLVSSFLTDLIIGLWLFYASSKLNQDKWTWLLIGLVYGIYSLIFFLVILILFDIKSEFKIKDSIKMVLLLLILVFIIKLSTGYLFEHYLKKGLLEKIYENEITVFSNDFVNYIKHMGNFDFIFGIILNFIFAIKIYIINKGNGLLEKLIWTISTLIFGLLSLILYNELMIIYSRKNNAA